MACKKCGSDWVTALGKDCKRCPHCCKQQRCAARKEGRWPYEVLKTCCVCGKQFEVAASRHNAKTCGNEKCRTRARSRIVQQSKERRKAGIARPQMPAKPRKACRRAGCPNVVKSNQHNYCTRRCAGADARECKRAFCGKSADVRAGLRVARFFHAWDAQRYKQQKRKRRPPCQNCGKEINVGSSRFCSYACVKNWRGTRHCDVCGADVPNSNSFSKCRCQTCKERLRKEANRKEKNRCGRNHRQRARHHGVSYMPVPVKAVYERDGYRCQICRRRCLKLAMFSKADGRIHPRSPTIDHIVPMACGGNHEPSNLQTACHACNSAKGARAAGQLRMAFV